MSDDILEQKFKDDLIRVFEKDTWQNSMYEYYDAYSPEDLYKKQSFNTIWEQVEDLEDFRHDSYGNENSTLGFIFKSKGSGDFIKVSGSRQSYVGEDWHSVRKVRAEAKTITYYT